MPSREHKLLGPAPTQAAPVKPAKEAEEHLGFVSREPEKSLSEFLDTLGLTKYVQKVEEAGMFD